MTPGQARPSWLGSTSGRWPSGGALERCLVVAPGALVLQWQEELWEKFRLDFRVFSRFTLETSQGNPFREHPLWIARMDGLARFPEVAAKALEVDWDLVVVDEAHKMAASYYGQEVKATRRYRLGQELSQRAKHFLLLTATPHRGKEEDFRLFLALLDPDRFLGKPRPNSPPPDAQGLWLRRQKEDLVRFDGTPLFPERRAYTVAYSLSPEEMGLYEAVTDYVREEMNRAEALEEGQRRTVGFALTLLQRRLASSPLAIYRSLERRRKRLEARREEVRRGLLAFPTLEEEDIEEKEEFPDEELEAAPEVLDQATAARTLSELEAEIATLRRLGPRPRPSSGGSRTGSGRSCRPSWRTSASAGASSSSSPSTRTPWTTWKAASRPTCRAARTGGGHPRRPLPGGAPPAPGPLHPGPGGPSSWWPRTPLGKGEPAAGPTSSSTTTSLEPRRAGAAFRPHPPHRPDRRSATCGTWWRRTPGRGGLPAPPQEAGGGQPGPGGRVFDVLGRLFQERPLKELLLRGHPLRGGPPGAGPALPPGGGAVDRERLEKLLQNALAAEVLDPKRLEALRLDMERAEALQAPAPLPGKLLPRGPGGPGGTAYLREEGRMEVSFVPAKVREARPGVLRSYTRVTFHKGKVSLPGKPVADFLVPGHPLLEGVLDAVLREWGHNLERGTVLVDENATTPASSWPWSTRCGTPTALFPAASST